jgi:DNA-binding CsgD family transcriptional regulator
VRVVRRFLGLRLRRRADALTARQREVAGLVSEGCTNREIAARLGIDERSAEGHVERIRLRLGFRSRAQVAAWHVAQRDRR